MFISRCIISGKSTILLFEYVPCFRDFLSCASRSAKLFSSSCSILDSLGLQLYFSLRNFTRFWMLRYLTWSTSIICAILHVSLKNLICFWFGLDCSLPKSKQLITITNMRSMYTICKHILRHAQRSN